LTADELHGRFAFRSSYAYLGKHTRRPVRVTSEQYDDHVSSTDLIQRCFFPTRLGSSLFQGTIDHRERQVLSLGLADQQML
jgi:hypothetical protein